ncbi:Cytochrome c oxidase subunit 1 [Pleodorina starrii]|nr:Cytochrome c oxidase subunit 1 [Pleodorina starrii]
MPAGGREAPGQVTSVSVVTRIVTAPSVRCVVSRPLPGPPNSSGQPGHHHEVLVFCSAGVCPLLSVRENNSPNHNNHNSPNLTSHNTSTEANNGVNPRLGQPLNITGAMASQISRVRDAACEPQSGLLVLAASKALLAMDNVRNEASRLSGHFKGWFTSSCDGTGDSVRYTSLRRIVAGPPGVLYVMDEQGPSMEDTNLRQVRFLGGACAAATLMPGDGAFTYDTALGALLYVTDRRTINRVTPAGGLEPLAGHEGGFDAVGGGGGSAVGGVGVGVCCRASHRVDGPAGRARFVCIADVAADEYGNVYVLDDGALRVMRWPDGAVSTLVPELLDRRHAADARLAALPGGRLAVWGFSNHHLMLLRLQLPAAAAAPPLRSPLRPPQRSPQRSPQRRLPPPSSSPPPQHEPSSPPPSARRARYGSSGGGASAATDFGAGAVDTDSPPDVILIAGDGGTSFPAHRAVLSARCLYFRQLLSSSAVAAAAAGGGGAALDLESFFHGGSSDGANELCGGAVAVVEVPLHGADPDALAAVLRHIYTGSFDHLTPPPPPTSAEPTPSAALRAVAALADRLLLPRLAARAQELLLRGVVPGTVVSELLWAERAGQEPLLGRLEEYFAAHVGEVARQAPESLDRLLEGGSRALVKRLLVARCRGGGGGGGATAGRGPPQARGTTGPAGS